MKHLIPIVIKQNEDQAVSARDIHKYLGVGRDFTTWIKERIEQYKFIEGKDYVLLTNLGEQKGRGGSNKFSIFRLEDENNGIFIIKSKRINLLKVICDKNEI